MDKAALRIMAIDDERFMLKLLAHLLAELGYTAVTTWQNAREALGQVDDPELRPDVILLDLNMPDMDGVEFVRHLVDRGYAGSLVLVSGEDERVLQMAERLVEAHHVDVAGHLGKPFSFGGLARVMDRTLQVRAQAVMGQGYDPERVRAAIAGGELVNYYQPKVAIGSRAVVGVETLVRWRHPEDGIVASERFIGTCEEHGLIDQLTRVVASEALRQAGEWHRAGLSLVMAINTSMDNLTSVDFAAFIADEALAAGVAPQQIVLEVTESRLMADQRAPLEVLTRLRMNRYRLSIDDFGTGHSSLKLLRDIPFDELKIDRSFVRDARHDRTARAIYDASLSLGRQLGMLVVAEGVESREHWDLVRDTGCDQAQGYYIARPMPADALPAWIEAWNAKATAT